MSAASRPALEARGLVKRYGEALVVDRVDLDLAGGRVDGLIGSNGAGKSTLVNLLTGRVGSDAGTVRVGGSEVPPGSPSEALELGIVAVPQELVMPMEMSVTEVVTFGAEPKRRGFLSRRRARQRVGSIFAALELEVDPEAAVSSLPVSLHKVVLLAQALHREARVLLLDEPTAAMSSEDSERVLSTVRRLRDQGLALLYISHRFDEVEELCDRVTAMADGHVIEVMEGAEVEHDRLVGSITGQRREEPVTAPTLVATERPAGTGRLAGSGIAAGALRGIDIEVSPGEVVGLAGLPGSGVQEAFELLAGHRRPGEGEVTIDGRAIRSARTAARLGVAFLPASRARAAMPSEPVLENLVLPALARCSRHGFISVESARGKVAPIVEGLSLRPVADRRMGQLSGGNQQRALVAGRLLAEPRFLLLEDPTVGVDIAARAELHELIRRLADEGFGCLVGSSEPDELLELCDRIVVLRRGVVVMTAVVNELSEYGLVSAMTGDRTSV
jgi:ABC-type sugar transport system ATPase subunit